MSNLREVVRCRHCRLVQFVLASRVCRKCKRKLDPPAEKILPVVLLQPKPQLDFAGRVRVARIQAHLSQKELGLSMGSTRQHINKIENDRCIPTLELTERLAACIGCAVGDFFAPVITEPADDALIAFLLELTHYANQLDHAQRERVRIAARDMAKNQVRHDQLRGRVHFIAQSPA
jgi:transcriptional regulator with XRE-family HTH domain